ncbi:hypothetical protein EV191_11967 [Tamaricihabitans halophyticus]|uniref:Excisionase family DNA binding protein n=1 Tax=Tamaricihabitans halophyticus TaxID=1262583 RepID=A0A4R2Q7F8_9PSEU|nr:DNA-binding protein [Tamaricihabitans halophyticus]TCP44782.1 hypothetical protein EV191_11967 [Tamaricihabitans halophyticus]
MAVALEAVLARSGLRSTAGEFLSLVEEAASRLSPPHPDPAQFFDPKQRAALRDVGLDLSAGAPDEPDGRIRAVAAQAVLRDSALTVPDAARALGVDTSRVRHRLADGRLSGWKDRRGWRLPAWQFTPNGTLPGLASVLAAVSPEQPPLVLAAFMTTVQVDLSLDDQPATPRQWLLAGGDPRPVAALASTLGVPA